MDRGGNCTRALRPGLGDPRATVARRRRVPGCARSSRQLVAALVTASLQHGTTGTSAHPLTEAVLTGTTTVVWLVGALHATLLDRTRPMTAMSGTDRREPAAASTRSRGTNLHRLGRGMSVGNTAGRPEQPWTRPPPALLACPSRSPARRDAGFHCPHRVDNNVDIHDAGPRRCR